MIILHNSYSKESRAFVAANPDAIVYDWYQGGYEQWLAVGGINKIRAFPSVIIEIPAMTISRSQLLSAGLQGIAAGKCQGESQDNLPTISIPAHQHVIDTPIDKEAVDVALATLNRELGADLEL